MRMLSEFFYMGVTEDFDEKGMQQQKIMFTTGNVEKYSVNYLGVENYAGKKFVKMEKVHDIKNLKDVNRKKLGGREARG